MQHDYSHCSNADKNLKMLLLKFDSNFIFYIIYIILKLVLGVEIDLIFVSFFCGRLR